MSGVVAIPITKRKGGRSHGCDGGYDSCDADGDIMDGRHEWSSYMVIMTVERTDITVTDDVLDISPSRI